MVKKLDASAATALDKFNQSVASDAEGIIFDVFPAKIIALNTLITETSSPSSLFHPSHAGQTTDARVYPAPVASDSNATNGEQTPPTKKRRLEALADGVAPAPPNDTAGARYPASMRANDHLAQVHDVIKKECEELARNCDKVKLWVNLSMPRIEDGDNFGVQVQEECLNELHRSQESCMNLRDAARQHHLNRAKIASKIIKYPHIADYTISLREHDEKQLYMARQNIYDLRNIYAVLFDILNKNIQKLRTPKGNNSSNMY